MSDFIFNWYEFFPAVICANNIGSLVNSLFGNFQSFFFFLYHFFVLYQAIFFYPFFLLFQKIIHFQFRHHDYMFQKKFSSIIFVSHFVFLANNNSLYLSKYTASRLLYKFEALSYIFVFFFFFVLPFCGFNLSN